MKMMVLVCWLAATPVFAHHSFGAEYDGNKPVMLNGVITSIQWKNPHFYFLVDAKGPDGKVANWKFEGYPPVVLNRIGWKMAETMIHDDTVTVFVCQARDGSNWAHSMFELIPLNEDHPVDLNPAWVGDSIGRWEGDTLVDPKALLHPYTITSKYMLPPGTRQQEYVCEESRSRPFR